LAKGTPYHIPRARLTINLVSIEDVSLILDKWLYL